MAALDFPYLGLTVGQKYPQPPVPGKPVYTWDGVKWTTGDTSVQAVGEPSNAIPRMDGDPGDVGTSMDYARGDHRHPIDASRAPIADPAFLGTPTAHTPPMGDNSERLATTAYVAEAEFIAGNTLPSNSDPRMNGIVGPGTSILYSRDDHIHPVDTSRAPLDSPALTGTPTATTPGTGSNNTRIATTEFVTSAISVVGGVTPSAATPLVESGAGAVGVAVAYARGDHVHPAGPTPQPATVAPTGDAPMAAVGVATKYAREDHVHPENPDAVTKTYVDSGLAGKSSTGHTHTAAQVTDFSEAVDDRVGSLLVAGTNIVLDYNDTANTLTVTSTAAGGGGGTGDVVGPVSAVADRIAVFSGTTGKLIKDGGALVAGLQPADTELTAIAGLVSATDRLPYFTGSGTASLAVFTGAARNLLDDADAPTMRTTLGLTSTATATPAALSRTDDTNVTLTLGGTPGTALLQAASITAGWTGTLSSARGGFGSNISASNGIPVFTTGVATFTATTTTAEYLANSAPTKILTSGATWGAAGTITTLTDGATVTPDFNLGIDFIWTLAAVGRTLANPTNTKVGQKGIIYLVQDATGSRTITTWGSAWKFQGGVKPPLSTVANSIDVLSYVVRNSGFIVCSFSNGFA